MYKKIPNRQTKNNTCHKFQPFNLSAQQFNQKMQAQKKSQQVQKMQQVQKPQLYPIAGIPGLPGLPGRDGSFIISGSGAPSEAIGKFRDMYINNISGDYYVKDISGWSVKSNLRGPRGENGSKIIVDAGQPSNAVGADSDFYIDSENGNYYTKLNGNWTFEGELQAGNNVSSSTITADYGVPDDFDGNYGDFYLDRNTGFMYYKDFENSGPAVRQQDDTLGANNINLGELGGSTEWVRTGTVGASLVQTGSSDPINSQGDINDFYINTVSGSYFSKDSSGWHQLGRFQVSTQSISNNYTVSNSDTYTNQSDTTQRLTFTVNGSSNTTTTLVATQTQDRTIILPDADDILVGRNTVDVLSNKSFSTSVLVSDTTPSTSTSTGALVVNGGVGVGGALNVRGSITAANLNGVNSGDVTIGSFNPISTTNGATITNQSLSLSAADAINPGLVSTTNQIYKGTKTFKDGFKGKFISATFVDENDNSKVISIDTSASTASTTTTLKTIQTVNRTITLPDATDTLVGQNTLDILTNKTLAAPIINNPVLKNGGLLTLPTLADTLVGRNTTDTLTNKTINSPTINNPVLNNGGVLTLPTSTDTLVGRETTDVLANKSFSTSVNVTSTTQSTNSTTGAIVVTGGVGIGGSTYIAGNLIVTGNITGNAITSGDSGNNLTVVHSSTPSQNGGTASANTITLTDADDRNPGLVSTAPQSFSGTKVFVDGLNGTIVDLTDKTKKLIIDSSTALSNTSTTLKFAQTVNHTITLPNTSDTLIGRNTVDTLTNKTLSTPSINNPVLNNGGVLTLPSIADTLVGRSTTDILTNKTLTAATINNPVLNNGGVLTLPTITDTLLGRTTTDTLTNKTLTAPTINNPVLKNGGTLTLPTSTDTLIGRSTTDTLANKTLTAPVISTINNGGTLTLPTLTDTLVGRATTDTLLNKTLSAPVISTILNGGTITLPTSTDTLVGRTTVDKLSNKSFLDTTTTFVNSSDTTKIFTYNLTGSTTGTTVTLSTSNTANQTVTLPNISDTLIGRTTTDVLSNKSFSTPVVITSSTTSTNTTNGALVISGGVGIGGNINIAGNITAANFNGISITIGAIGSSSSANGATVSGQIITLTPADGINPGLITASNQTIGGVKTFQNGFTGKFIAAQFIDGGDNTKAINIDTSLNVTNTSTVLQTAQTANRTITLPDASDVLIGRTTIDTLTNKTLTTPSISSIINSGTLTLPTITDTLVGRTTVDTLTNKTLTAPTISTIKNGGTLTLPTSSDTIIGRATTDVLSNKTFVDTTTTTTNATDATKVLIYNLAGSTTGTTTTLATATTTNRILTLPDATDVLVARATVDTLSNKTLILPTIASIKNGGTLTLPTLTDTLVAKTTTDTLINKTLTAPIISTIINSGTLTLPTSTDTLVGRATTDVLTNKTLTTPTISSIINGGTLTLPSLTDTLVGRSTTDVLNNKSLIDTTTPFVNSTDNTKKLVHSLVNATTGTTVTIAASNTANRTITLPDATDTLIGRATTDTLTNKTLTTPVISTITNGGTLTLPSSTDTLIGRATTDILSNKSFSTVVNITSTTASTSSTSGALIVSGGVGIGGNINITGNITAANFTGASVTIGTFGSSSSTNGATASGSIITLTPADASNPGLITASTQTIGGVKTFQAGFIGRHIGATLVDSTDNTKIIAIDTSGSTTSTTTTLKSVQTANRTITFPDATDTLIGRSTTDTLLNKTLTTPVISTIINNGTLTLPTTTDTLVGRTTTDVLSNKSFSTNVNITATTQTSSTTTGALIVAGGVGVGGSLYANTITNNNINIIGPIVNVAPVTLSLSTTAPGSTYTDITTYYIYIVTLQTGGNQSTYQTVSSKILLQGGSNSNCTINIVYNSTITASTFVSGQLNRITSSGNTGFGGPYLKTIQTVSTMVTSITDPGIYREGTATSQTPTTITMPIQTNSLSVGTNSIVATIPVTTTGIVNTGNISTSGNISTNNVVTSKTSYVSGRTNSNGILSCTQTLTGAPNGSASNKTYFWEVIVQTKLGTIVTTTPSASNPTVGWQYEIDWSINNDITPDLYISTQINRVSNSNIYTQILNTTNVPSSYISSDGLNTVVYYIQDLIPSDNGSTSWTANTNGNALRSLIASDASVLGTLNAGMLTVPPCSITFLPGTQSSISGNNAGYYNWNSSGTVVSSSGTLNISNYVSVSGNVLTLGSGLFLITWLYSFPNTTGNTELCLTTSSAQNPFNAGGAIGLGQARNGSVYEGTITSFIAVSRTQNLYFSIYASSTYTPETGRASLIVTKLF